MPVPRHAVIGSGIAGLVAAHVLGTAGPVTLYEADDRLGGHADTHEVHVAGRTLHVDTGFIVHNDRTYPTLLRLFAELGVPTQDSDMSMSVRHDGRGLEYAGALGARGLFAQVRNVTNPSYLRMLAEVRRFHRAAAALLAAPEGPGDRDEALGDFLRRGQFSDYFLGCFMEPLVAAVWSCDPEVALDYPARYLFEFLDHHGMLTVFGSPTWRTVVGGSARYVEKVAAGVADLRVGTPVVSVWETGDGVVVEDGTGGLERFDGVVVATHPDQALRLLASPTDAQREVLSSIPYSRNVAQLHTDESLLPRAVGARASWNYWRRDVGDDAVLVTYDLTRLQRLDPRGPRMLVTLNGGDVVDPRLVIDTMAYAHPLYTPESVAAQRLLPSVNTARVAFAGAYHGWGFHEDGARSGVGAAAHLGVEWGTATRDSAALEVAR
jgi:predicted NAD/FAD-binding protein